MGHDVVALAKQFVQLREAKQNEEAAMMVSDDIKITKPTITGHESFQGKATVKEQWKKQDKDMPKIVKTGDFVVKNATTVTRRLTAKKLMLTLDVDQTIKINSEGKICEALMLKA